MRPDVDGSDLGVARQRAPWRWWLAFSMAVLLPWLLVFGSAAVLEAWLPGVVLVTHWKLFSTLAFLAGALAAVRLVLATSGPLALRVIASGLLMLGGTVLALVFQIEPRCGDENPYIGRKPDAVQVGMCG